MNFKLETPKIVQEAREAKKGWNWFVELLVFVLMFLIVTIGQVIILFPIELFIMLTDKEFISAALSGNEALIEEVTERLVSSDILTIASLFSTIAMTLLVMAFCKLIQKRKMRTIGFVKKGFLKEYGIGLIIGFAIFSIAVLFCVLTGALKIEGVSDSFSVLTFLLFAIGFMIQGMGEEVLCRGYLMVSIGRRYPMWAAVLLNSLFFAALHLANDGISTLAFINLTLFGIFASVYFIKRGSIWGIGAIHSIWNFVQGNFYGIKVSGMGMNCTVFESATIAGKDLIHGGAFGLEGGLAVTIVLVAGTLALLCRPAKDAVVENREVTKIIEE